MNEADAQEALDQISETKRAVAQRSSAPPGYYAVLGLAMGLLVATQPAPLPWRVIGLVAGLILVGVSATWYRRSVDTWAWGDLKGKGAWIIWVMLLIGFGGLLTSLLVDSFPLAIGLGVLILCVWSILGPMWDRAYVTQVQERK